MFFSCIQKCHFLFINNDVRQKNSASSDNDKANNSGVVAFSPVKHIEKQS